MKDKSREYETEDAFFNIAGFSKTSYYKLVEWEQPVTALTALNILQNLGYTKAESQARIETLRVRKAATERKTSEPMDRKGLSSVPRIQEANGGTLYCFGRKNPRFILRDELLVEVHTALQEHSFVALTGIGGIGKTETAIAYCHEFAAQYNAVYYLLAETSETILISLRELWIALNPSNDTPPPPDVIQRRILDIWNRTEHNLVLLDNANDIVQVAWLLQQIHQGHVLLTSQDRQYQTTNEAQKWLHCVPVAAMRGERGVEFVLRRAGRLATHQEMSDVPEEERRQAGMLVDDVEGLPLSLEIAASSLAMGLPITEYRNRYEERDSVYRTLATGGFRPHRSIYSTFEIAFDSVLRESRAAADLLCLVAVLAPVPVPDRIFTQGATVLGDNLHEAANPGQWEERILRAATCYGILRHETDANPERHTLLMHREVQRVLHDKLLRENALYEWQRRAALSVAATFPPTDFSYWADCNLFLPHALACIESIHSYHWDEEWAANLISETATFLNHASARQGLQLFQRALAIREKVLGTEHPKTAQSLVELASCYMALGNYMAGLYLCTRAVALFEKVLGPEHPDAARSLHVLANLYACLNEKEKAQTIFEQALALYEKVLGPEHPSTAQILTDLSFCYSAHGDIKNAISVCERALAIREKVLGPEHPGTAQSLNHLAAHFRSQNDIEKALSLCERALAIREKVLGPEDSDTATSLTNMADLYRQQGNNDMALTLSERALAILDKTWGRGHPETANLIYLIAIAYSRQGRHREAEQMYQHANAIFSRQL